MSKTTKIQMPDVKDYLPQAISKAVRQKSFAHPFTLYPVALGAGAAVTGFLFDFSILYFSAGAGIIFGFVYALSQIFFLHDKIGSKYIAQLNQKQKDYQKSVYKMLQTELEECSLIKGAHDYAQQGISQFIKIEEKLRNVQDILDIKIETTEITYGRFSGAAEQVALSVLDNLKNIAATLKSAGSIDTDYISQRLNAIEYKKEPDTDNIKQKQALLQRLELKKQQFGKVNILLTKNEEAMTEMEKISAAVSHWQSDDNFSDIDYESAIARLQELAQQAQEYNKK